MVVGLPEVTAALQGTSLAGLPVRDGPGGALVVPGIAPDTLHDAWRAAHAVLPVTGRWPVLVADDPFEHSVDVDLAELDRAARTFDPWPYFQEEDDGDAAEDDQVPLEYFTSGRYGIDVTAEVLPRVALPVGRQELLRRAYDHVLSDPALAARVLGTVSHVVRPGHWFTPREVWLMLLPTAFPWLAPPWIGFYGTLGEEYELAAALWQWRRRWDARLVAGWRTMLQFEVHRPPAPGDDAWAAARQILALGPSFDIQQWELAVAVPESEAWFIHNRP
ncbi:DUF4253 domain-containing protein [Dactylosporangium sp. NPDC049525]|uniref:DUF4253 domain-containing protein n=1 Tax=Dactylosporangium sp. NPDC049525 TaxID=3154730 RepID=UPI003439541C